jgi:hypothetical protein
MRSAPPKVARGVRADYAGFIGPLVPEGQYKIKLIKGDQSFEGKLDMVPLPWSTHSKEDRALGQATTQKLFAMCEELHDMNEQLLSIRDTAKAMLEKSKDNKSLTKSLNEFIAKCEKQHAVLVAVKEGTAITGEEKIRERLSELYASVAFFEGKPTDSQIDRMNALRKEMDDAHKLIDELVKTDLLKLNTQLMKAKIKG